MKRIAKMNMIPSNRHSEWMPLMCPLVFCVLGFLIYANTLHAPFVLDDFLVIVDNPGIRMDDFSVIGLLKTGFTGLSRTRPLAKMTFAVNYYMDGYRVFGYHLVNIVIHIVNALMVCLISGTLLRKSISPPGKADEQDVAFTAAVSGLIFLCHPLQVQSVTYIVQRMNSLSVLFYLVAFFFYLKGRHAEEARNRWICWTVCFLTWGLSVATKPIAVSFLAVPFLYEHVFVRKGKIAWLRTYWWTLPLAAAVLYILLLLLAGGFDFMHDIAAMYEKMHRNFTISQRLMTQLRVVLFYLTLIALPLPSRLNIDHHITPSTSLLEPITTLASLLVLAVMLLLAFFPTKKRPLTAFGILWYVITIAPSSSFIGDELIFEHRTYLPLLGICMILMDIAIHPLVTARRKLAVAGAAMLILLLCAGTYARNQAWQSDITLWEDAASKNPQGYRSHNNLGNALINRERYDEGTRALEKAVAINPLRNEAYFNLGRAYHGLGLTEKAEAFYYKSLDRLPEFAPAHVNLGYLYEKQGRRDKAVTHYQMAIRIDPRSAEAHNNLGLVYLTVGRTDDAAHHFERALLSNPRYAKALNNMGLVHSSKGQYREALPYFLKAVRENPKYVDAHANLCLAYGMLGNLEEREKQYRIVLLLDKNLALKLKQRLASLGINSTEQ